MFYERESIDYANDGQGIPGHKRVFFYGQA